MNIFRVETADYSAIPPTDPYVTNSVIRFFSNQGSNTTLTHNFATRQAIRHCGRFWVWGAGRLPTISRTSPTG
jgi:hypothetical protein